MIAVSRARARGAERLVAVGLALAIVAGLGAALANPPILVERAIAAAERLSR